MLDNTFEMTVTIKHSLKKYLKENTDVNVVAHYQDLVKKMEDRNADGTLKSTTIA
jgi:hypothetical protein